MFTALMPIVCLGGDFLFLLPDEDQGLQIFGIFRGVARNRRAHCIQFGVGSPA